MSREPLLFSTGQRFGHIVVLYRMDYQAISSHGWYWLCRCDCGKEWPVVAGRIARAKSCGCLHREYHRKRLTTHGMTHSPAWRSYRAAYGRCKYPYHKNYAIYGGRGIRFKFTSFEQFFAELGPRPEGKTLDRIDPDGHYEPGNVRWATPSEQNHNQRFNKGRFPR